MDLSPAEQLAHSTVRIECDLPGGRIGTGTGFFYSLNKNGDQHIPVIITNKHVVQNSLKGRFFLTLQNGHGGPDIGRSEAFELTNFDSCWTQHPDENVDLCVMPLAPLLRQAQERGSRFFFVPFDKTLIPSKADVEDMIGLESITMVGYPDGIGINPIIYRYSGGVCLLRTTSTIGTEKLSF
jgi:hypothetical protein